MRRRRWRPRKWAFRTESTRTSITPPTHPPRRDSQISRVSAKLVFPPKNNEVFESRGLAGNRWLRNKVRERKFPRVWEFPKRRARDPPAIRQRFPGFPRAKQKQRGARALSQRWKCRAVTKLQADNVLTCQRTERGF